MPKGIYYDGDFFTASPCEGMTESNPFPSQPFTKVFAQKFSQFRVDPDTGAPVFKVLPLSTAPAQSGMKPLETFVGGKNGRGPWLTGESDRIDIGAGILEWTRTWAHVPATIYEFPGMGYQRQKYCMSSVPGPGVYDTWGNFHGTYRTFTSVEEWTEPLTGIVERRFLRVPLTTKPTDMLARFRPLVPYRIVKFNDERGKEHVFELGKQGVAEPTTVTAWMGEIFEIRNVYVQPANMGSVLQSAGFFGFNLAPSQTFNPVTGQVTGFAPATLSGGGLGGAGGDNI
jgi:hypothetical protein